MRYIPGLCLLLSLALISTPAPGAAKKHHNQGGSAKETAGKTPKSADKPQPLDAPIEVDDLLEAYDLLKNHPDKEVRQRAELWHELTKYRKWDDATGQHSVEARFVSYDPKSKSIAIRTPQVRDISLAVDKLSGKDIKVVLDLATLKPQIAADVKKSRPSPPQGNKSRGAR